MKITLLDLRKNKAFQEFGLVLLIFLGTNIASQVFQSPITYNNGQSFDGIFYTRMAYQFTQGLKVSSEAPFVYRIGTPFLVSVFFKDHLLFGFKVVNILANLLATLLLTFWLRLYLSDWRVRVLLVGLFITQWHGPVRFTYYDGAYTDPWLFVFLLIGLIAIHRLKSKPGFGSVALLGFITFMGVLFREIVLILPIALFFVNNPLPPLTEISNRLTLKQLGMMLKRSYFPSILPLLLGIAGFLLVRRVASQTNDYTFFKSALDWAYDKPVLTVLHAYFITFGPLLVLAIFAWRRSIQFLWDQQYLLVFLVGMMAIGWIGGSDTERFLYWGMPVVYLLIGLSIQENWARLKSPGLVLLLLASTICSQRLFWTVPDFPNTFHTPIPILSILSSRFQYLDLWSFFAQRSIQEVSLLQYLLLSAVLLVWLKLRPDPLEPDG